MGVYWDSHLDSRAAAYADQHRDTTRRAVPRECVVCGHANSESGSSHRRCLEAIERAERRGEQRAAPKPWRPTGWYWVRTATRSGPSDWRPGQWSGGRWYVSGDSDIEVVTVGPWIEVPEDDQ